jgi:hypothetical protein
MSLRIKGWISKYIGQQKTVEEICRTESKNYKQFLDECRHIGIDPQSFGFNPKLHKDTSTHWILKYVYSGKTLIEIAKLEKLTESEVLVALLNIGKQQADLLIKGNIMLGLDVGTSRLLAASYYDNGATIKAIQIVSQRDAFIELDANETTMRALKRQKVNYVIIGKKVYIVGDNAYDFGNVFPNQELRRPMANGMLSIEPSALPVLKELIGALIGKAPKQNAICAYSIPAMPVDIHKLVQYHTDVVEGIVASYGYKPVAVNEGIAVANIGLEPYDLTGLALSFGGGLINACLMYKGLSALQISVSQAGDFIDGSAARDLGLTPIQVNTMKEQDVFNIGQEQTTREGQAIKSYYILCIRHALSELAKFFGTSDKMPHFADPVHVACAGGGVLIPGFADAFEKEFNALNMPFKLAKNGVHVVDDPLTAVARGCLLEAEFINE